MSERGRDEKCVKKEQRTRYESETEAECESQSKQAPGEMQRRSRRREGEKEKEREPLAERCLVASLTLGRNQLGAFDGR